MSKLLHFVTVLECVSYNEWYTTRLTWQLLPFTFNVSEQAATETMF